MAMGRPQRPYLTSWGEHVTGLYKCHDGRWRINSTGQKYTEADERRAIQKYRDATNQTRPVVTMSIARVGTDSLGDAGSALAATLDTEFENGQAHFIQRVPEEKVWLWLREKMIEDPAHVARMVGIPEVANLRHMALPKAAINIAELIEKYKAQNPSTEKSKREAVAVFERLQKHADAKVLDDLSTEALLAWKLDVEKAVNGPATRAAYYGRIKSILAFGLKVALDPLQIRAVLDRCRVLWTAEALPQANPKPISRKDFHILLSAAGNGPWRAWLLVGLNLCMSIEEVCGLSWKSFDLEAGTFAAIREKTKRERIPRAATLWPQTLELLKAMPKKGPYVFTSAHGTRYNRNSRVNNFAEFRKAIGLGDGVTFSTLRDGAYSAAAQGTTDDRLPRVLAGHVSPGLMDRYVLRNPEMVRPACNAVYKAYGPF